MNRVMNGRDAKPKFTDSGANPRLFSAIEVLSKCDMHMHRN